MDSLNSTRPVMAHNTPVAPAAAEKPGITPENQPRDEYAPLRPEPEIHSLKDYGKNIADSTTLGFVGGFIRTGEAVEKFMPSYDGLDHPGKHILCAIPPLLAGVVGGVAGAGAGLAMGIFGKNIGTHMTEKTLQS